MPLLDALRVLTELEPAPGPLPGCDLAELADVLEAHGLAPLASYNLEYRGLGRQVPGVVRERLLAQYQGVVNDNVYKLVTLKQRLAGVEAGVVLLGAAAYVDWLYPHVAFRPVAELRLAVKGEEGARFAAAFASDDTEFRLVETGAGGHSALFSDGRIDVRIQEGVVLGGAGDAGLFERARPIKAFGPRAARPAAEDALLCAVADQAQLGLYAPLITFVDVRELLRQRLDAAAVRARAGRLGLERALYGSLSLVARLFPAVAAQAMALAPELPAAQRMAVDALVESAGDPAKLRHLRGAEEAGRLLLAPALR